MALRSSSILAAVAFAAAGLAPMVLTGCAPDRETTLSRTARQRKIQALVTEGERLENEREVLVRRTQELRFEIGQARQQSVNATAALRATKAALNHELGRLQVAEQDLAAVRQRAGEIEKELQPLRAVEQTLREYDKRMAEAQQRKAKLEKDLAAVEAAAGQATKELQPKVDALQKKLSEAQQATAAVTAAQAALLEAGKVLGPPPPPPAKKK